MEMRGYKRLLTLRPKCCSLKHASFLLMASFHVILLAGIIWNVSHGNNECTAGEFNRVLSLGDRAPSWIELPGVDGNLSSLKDYTDKSVLVVTFTCNSCPYAVDVERRLIELQNWLAEHDGQLVAINVNKVEEDLPDEMKIRSDEVGFNFPYLFDETQDIARRYGATTTPEFYVLDRDRNVRYMGSLDDSPDGKAVENQYVRDAVRSLLNSEKITNGETVPIGCRIRFERTRRGR